LKSFTGLPELLPGLSQVEPPVIPEPFIKSRQDKMEQNSRFNYALDMSVDKRKINLSGELIANEDSKSNTIATGVGAINALGLEGDGFEELQNENRIRIEETNEMQARREQEE
jgi:hypothetical protein